MDETEKARLKDTRTRLRRARSALRKLEKAKAELKRLDELTDWETEFIVSVTERLDKYDSAFANPELGGRLEALSARQKQVLAQMRRKIKDKSKQTPLMMSKPETRSLRPIDKMPNRAPEKQYGRPNLKIIDGGKS